jgi:hypothetical protein
MAGLVGFDRSFAVGDLVNVPSQDYSGEVIEVRGTGATAEYLVRYTIDGALRQFYETWWPVDYLLAVAP